jgi:hypothetical protein
MKWCDMDPHKSSIFDKNIVQVCIRHLLAGSVAAIYAVGLSRLVVVVFRIDTRDATS